MLGSLRLRKLTSGTEMSGSAPGERTRNRISLSSSNSIGSSQWPHRVLTMADRYCCLNRPCTKGVASASMPHAAVMRSPVWSRISCGVSAAVTG